MDVHRAADDVFDEIAHLERMLCDDEGCYQELDETGNELALSQSKRVARTVRVLVRTLAERRDQQLQPGGTSE